MRVGWQTTKPQIKCDYYMYEIYDVVFHVAELFKSIQSFRVHERMTCHHPQRIVRQMLFNSSRRRRVLFLETNDEHFRRIINVPV